MAGSSIGMADWLAQHMLSCPSKKLFLVDCPGCGLQRSIIYMLKGDFAASWHIYPPGIFVVATLIALLLHLIFKFSNGALVLKCLFITTTIVMAINYIYKITTNQII